MRTFLCPRCGETVEEGHPDFPRCVYCGEHLLRCGFCTHFPGDGKPCRRARGNPIVWAETILPCPFYAPRFLIRSTHPLFSPQTRWQIAASFLLTFSVVLVAFFSRPTPSRLLLAGSAPSRVVVGGVVEIRFLVRGDVKEPIRLRLDRRLLSDFHIVGITPLPFKILDEAAFYEFQFRPSGKPTLPIVLRLKSLRAGTFSLQATLLTTSGEAMEWQGTIAVLKERPKRRAPKRLGLLAMLIRG